MYKIPKRKKIPMYTVEEYEGETIEKKVRRVVENNEPIGDGAEVCYTEKKDGVRPEFDVRTDKWDIALNAMDAVNKSKIAKSEQYMKTEKPTTEQPKTEQPKTE